MHSDFRNKGGIKMKRRGIIFWVVLVFSLLVFTPVKANNLTIAPKPTGAWSDRSVDLYVQFDGDPQTVNWANNRYGVSDAPNMPVYNQTFTAPGKINLNYTGEKYVHVRYQLSNDTYVYTTAGPYRIFPTSLNDFQAHITTVGSVTPQDWAKEALELRIVYAGNEITEGIERQYKIKGIDQEWKVMQNTFVPLLEEGKQDILYRVVNKAGKISETKSKTYKMDLTPVVFHHVALEETENGQYHVLVWAVDAYSGIASVKVETSAGDVLLSNESMTSIYKANAIEGEPIKVVATDIAGNVTEETFLEKPVIAFGNYNPNADVHHTTIQGVVTGEYDVSYVFNGKKTLCGNTDCIFTIDGNGLLTAHQVDGIKRTSIGVRIDNVDTREVQLMLQGERHTGSDMAFKWNYQLNAGATLSCLQGEQPRVFQVTGKTHTIQDAANLKYACTLLGTYQGQQLTSNTVYLHANPREAVPVAGNYQEEPLLQMVYIEESRMGTSYFINARRSNVNDNRALVPTDVFP